LKIETLAAFVDLLRREQTLLVGGDVEALPALTEAKLLLVRELESASADSKPNEKFLSLAHEARTLNEANGKLIALHMQHNRQSLSVLTEAARVTHATTAVTYGPDGQTQAGQGGRLFGSA